MKRFEIITEADARVLEPGSTVSLVRGGVVTPLAKDTLRERRIDVIQDGQLEVDLVALAPAADIRRVVVACDHTGLAMKKAIVDHLRGRGLSVNDLGTHTPDAVDYPDVAGRVADAVAANEADAGIVVDGAGIGSAIAANKVPGVRAALCLDETIARYAREHNGANVATLGSSLLTPEQAIPIVDRFLGTPMREPRYIRRLAKIRELEKRAR